MGRRTSKLRNKRGQELHLEAFTPEGPVQAVLVFHHGYGEHIGRYQEVFQSFPEAGIALHAYDAHGHGRSEPQEPRDRCLIWSFDHLVDDLGQVGRHVCDQYPAGTPMFVGGQSMGALTSLHLMLRDESPWRGVVLGTATIDVEWNWVLRVQASVGNLLAKLIPRAQIVPAVRGEDMTDDPDLIEDMVQDPFNFLGPVRVRTALSLLNGFRGMQRDQGRISLPIYAHHGMKDKLASLPAVKRLLQCCESTDVTLKEFPDGYHEIFMNVQQHEAIDCITEWMLDRCRP